MTQRRDLQALIDAAPVGKMQWRVIICCFLVVMLDGFDTAAIGFIAPDIRTHWQLSASELAPLFGAGLLGLTAGALLCGPLADRFGRKRVIELCVALFGALSLLSAFSPDIETPGAAALLNRSGSGRSDAEYHHHDVGIPSRSPTRSAGHADVLWFYPGVGDGRDCERATGAADWLARNSGVRRHLAFDAVFSACCSRCRNLPAGRYAVNYRKRLSPGRSAPLPASAITIRNSFCMRPPPSPKAVFASFLPGGSLSLP